MTTSRMNWAGAGAVAVFSFLAMPAFSATIGADFIIKNSTPSATSGGHIDFTLNGDGTISALLTSVAKIVGFGFDSVASNLPESGFSVAIANAFGWLDSYGSHNSGFFANGDVTSISWTIGNPGDFTALTDALGGGNSAYDFYLLDSNGDEWAADAGDVSGEVPLPAGAPLLLAGLGALGLVAKRRKV